jgi:nucleoside-diphosphate-sugar epimerase
VSPGEPVCERDGVVLVTGASGYIGGRLALRLRRDGRVVRALVRLTSHVEHLVAAGVELVRGDIRNPQEVARAVQGVQLIYHIAGVFRTASHSDSLYMDVNLGGTENVMAAAKRHGVSRVVHNSTIGVHGDVQEIPCTEDTPFNPGDAYQRSKAAGERCAREAFASGLPGTVCRPASVYGPGDLRNLKLFKMLRLGRFWMFGSGETLFHPAYIDDLIEGLLLCGSHPAAIGRTYLLAGPQYVTLNEWVAAAARAVHCQPPRRRLPYWPLAVGAAVCEALCVPLGIEPPLHRRRARFFVNNRAFSSARAQEEIGYNPRVGVIEGCRRTAAWYFEQGHLR